jgi:hypothetical protein
LVPHFEMPQRLHGRPRSSRHTRPAGERNLRPSHDAGYQPITLFQADFPCTMGRRHSMARRGKSPSPAAEAFRRFLALASRQAVDPPDNLF